MLRGAEYPAGRIAVSEPRVDERTDFFVTPPVVLGEPIVVTVIVRHSPPPEPWNGPCRARWVSLCARLR